MLIKFLIRSFLLVVLGFSLTGFKMGDHIQKYKTKATVKAEYVSKIKKINISGPKVWPSRRKYRTEMYEVISVCLAFKLGDDITFRRDIGATKKQYDYFKVFHGKEIDIDVAVNGFNKNARVDISIIFDGTLINIIELDENTSNHYRMSLFTDPGLWLELRPQLEKLNRYKTQREAAKVQVAQELKDKHRLETDKESNAFWLGWWTIIGSSIVGVGVVMGVFYSEDRLSNFEIFIGLFKERADAKLKAGKAIKDNEFNDLEVEDMIPLVEKGTFQLTDIRAGHKQEYVKEYIRCRYDEIKKGG